MSEYIYEHKPSGADHMGKPVELPTLVQREEIVRCHDCDSASFDEFGGGWCIENCREIKAWYFCAWARKKGSLENGI